MIDIHNHVLPCFDDGPTSLEDSLALLRMAAESGITTIFATPHVTDMHEVMAGARIVDEVEKLRSAVAADGIPIELATGAEVVPTVGVLKALDDGTPLTLAGKRRHILLEMPTMSLPVGIGQFVFDLQSRGITPIFAHPERIQPVQEDPRLLEEFVERGALIQITASALVTKRDEAASETARTFLRLKWAHFVASDAHSPNRRRPRLAEAAEALREMMDEDDVDDLVRGNGQRVLNGESVLSDPMPYRPAPRRGWLSRLFARG